MPDPTQAALEPATLLLHKPAGFDAIEGSNPASRLVTPETHWAGDASGITMLPQHFARLTPMVALDREDSGLMVLTQDGRVRRRLSEDADQIEHEYNVEVSGEIHPWGLRRLNQGLRFQGRELPGCKVSWQNEIRLRFAIKAVRPGQLRDMCAQVGLDVVAIRRIRIGRIPLAKLPVGAWRYLPVGAKF
jgi:23S rRNA pseudouridine2604 synthase